VPIVGEAFHQHRHPAGGVALVGDLLVVHALQLAGALLDGPGDVVPGHIGLPGGEDGGSEAGVAGRVSPSQPRGDGDLLDQLGEELPLARAHRFLLALDLRPTVVTGHGSAASLIESPAASA